MLEKYSYVITIILLISSIVSPIITTIINIMYQLYLKKLEMYEMAKRNAIENFIKCASNCSNKPISNGILHEYNSSVNNLYIYFKNVPDSTKTLINLSNDNFFNELTNIVQVLAKQIDLK